MKKQEFTISLNEQESWFIALLFKRLSFDGVMECAIDKNEAYRINDVIEKASQQLVAQGMAPR